MKNSNAVLVWNSNKNTTKDAALKEVLFTPSVKWVENTLDSLGFDTTKVILESGIDSKSHSLATLSEFSSGEALGQLLKDTAKYTLVLGADAPLIKPEDIEGAYQKHISSKREATVFADGDRFLTGSGWYNTDALIELIRIFKSGFSLEELYGEIKEVGFSSISYIVETIAILPVDSALNLNKISTAAKEMEIEKHLVNGVNIPVNDGVIISPTSIIEAGATILVGTILKGDCVIKSGAVVGPHSVLLNATIGENTAINSSHIEDSAIGAESKIGPMTRVRPGSNVGDNVKIGNFVEIKNATIGNKTAVSHLTYIGDSNVGESCNIACGVVTVNYDGTNKHRTTIEDNVFIGCNCNLVAPVTVKRGAYAAAGTTITHEVPEDSLVIGRVRQEVKKDWRKNKGLFEKK